MKNANRQFNISKLAHKLCVCVVCALFVFVLTFAISACSKHDYSPSDYENQTDDDTPSTSNTQPDVQPSQQELVEAFLSNLATANDNDATTTLTVSFGGRTLSQKTIDYARSANGGNVKTTTVSLNTANAKDPYTTTESTETLDKSAFESKFPTFKLSLDYSALKNPQLVTNNDLTALNFAIDRANVSALVGLSATDAQNIASDVDVIITKKNNVAKAIGLCYTTANGNTVEIVTEYKSQQA